ncbi:ATP-binding protein [Sunxiuqinia dokdonensis]|uniref:Endonuclease GajA/Old nuclease/RecF-like AAA domain-containing protein n=1 Tax=Sunxiuqinia dokdonensis TaxID=1409788 RepID=A0A0L8V5H4_9BACT|nr:ATP-binding protein [Sunxiuqinia dokdonensis]KOH43730.1 hypothetical protein NC99_34990 [Sunxiuqinia dokdonensis]
MKLNQIKIKNFRGYRGETIIPIQNLNVFVGKNDVGKSTILEALDIFFNENKGVVKIDKEDVNKVALANAENEIIISVIFDELPERLVLDATNETSLVSEYLLNSDGRLEVVKTYPNGSGSAKVFVKANHPTHEICADLLQKKQADLRKIIKEQGIDCENQTRNAVMRSAIWYHFHGELQCEEREIDVTKGETKDIWEKLKIHLPLYSLFQSDRKNSDGDSEVQEPMQFAVSQILKNPELQTTLDGVAEIVTQKLNKVAEITLAKIREMNPEIADSLTPVIPSPDSLKWKDVFKNVSITGDENIPINKRGSGVKRLILLNFFRAEAERRRTEHNIPSIVYAIEEPETSQHSQHQKQLTKALIRLSEAANTQIILTTHSPVIVKELNFNHLKMVLKDGETKTVVSVEPGQLPYPSLNEVNFSAFNEITEEYHNELYGFIENEGCINEFRNGKQTMAYTKVLRGGNTRVEQIILTDYIRHQIHHPENVNNVRFTEEQLGNSIRDMRQFIKDEQLIAVVE